MANLDFDYRKWTWRGLKSVALIAVIGAVVYWLKFSPTQVREHLVARGELRAEVMGTGTLEARVKASISPKISGRVRTITVDQGDTVCSGKVLVTLDDEDLQQQVEIAEANFETVQAAIDRLKSDEARADATLTQAKSEHQRTEQLVAKNVATQSDSDKSVEALAIAEVGGISLAAVGVTSFVGFLGRWRAGKVEIRTGLVFAAAGMLGAPVGSWLSGLIPETVLLSLFAIRMLGVALRMWSNASEPAIAGLPIACSTEATDVDGPACRRDGNGNLLLTSRCARLLAAVGIVTGVLSGLFGVSGGFVIVPALVMFSGMAIHRAVGTSLLVITLVSVSAIASHLFAGRSISVETTALFVVGGVSGLLLGNRAGRRLSGPALQKVFAGAIVAVALFVIVRTVSGTSN